MPSSVRSDTTFPRSLFDWGNSGSAAVCRYSDDSSGWQKPPLKTRLISRLERLAEDVKSGAIPGGCSLFLVGGPGNGKTHAAKYLQRLLLGDGYVAVDPVEGVVSYSVSTVPGLKEIRFIEDASAGLDNDSSYQRFVEDVEKFTINRPEGCLFICCVNRGILATVLARIAKGQMIATDAAASFIARLSSVVSPDATPTSLWPLSNSTDVYVHPMDEESLLEPIEERAPIAAEIVDEICSADAANCEGCASRGLCPMYANLIALRDASKRDNLLRVLRYFEIVASKRLSFRDLFSIVSVLVVGSQNDYVLNGKKTTPCAWVEKQVEQANANRQSDRLLALFELEMSLYHNRLFSNWRDFKRVDRELLRSIKSSKSSTIVSTQGFFKSLSSRIRKTSGLLALRYLENIAASLDPALQDVTDLPDMPVEVASGMRNVEEAFCKSLSLGIETFQKTQQRCWCEIEDRFLAEGNVVELNQEVLDMSVSDPEFPVTQKVISAMRIVFSRIAKRSIGAANGVVYQGGRLSEFRQLLQGGGGVTSRKRKLCDTIRNYLYPDGRFTHSMLATFGQSEPDVQNGFFFESKRVPRFTFSQQGGDSATTQNILFVRETDMGITLKVNFDLYSALVDLQTGLSSASLPERIYDIFDGVKARIQGYLSHNWDPDDMSFSFPDRNKSTRVIHWNDEEGFYED